MARLAGLELEQRVADWDGSPFTADSESHVSVWRKPPCGRPLSRRVRRPRSGARPAGRGPGGGSVGRSARWRGCSRTVVVPGRRAQLDGVPLIRRPRRTCPPPGRLLGVVAALAETLTVVPAGRPAGGSGPDVVGVPDGRVAPRCPAPQVARHQDLAKPAREHARHGSRREQVPGPGMGVEAAQPHLGVGVPDEVAGPAGRHGAVVANRAPARRPRPAASGRSSPWTETDCTAGGREEPRHLHRHPRALRGPPRGLTVGVGQVVGRSCADLAAPAAPSAATRVSSSPAGTSRHRRLEPRQPPASAPPGRPRPARRGTAPSGSSCRARAGRSPCARFGASRAVGDGVRVEPVGDPRASATSILSLIACKASRTRSCQLQSIASRCPLAR